MHFRTKLLQFIQAGTAVALALTVGPLLMARAAPEAEYSGSQVCAGCHQELTQSFTHSVHSRLASFELSGQVSGCESCHGPGSKHTESLDAADIFHFERASADEANSRCLKCHSEGIGMFWSFAEHGQNGISCVNCHSIHSSRSLLPADPGRMSTPELNVAGQIAPPRRASLAKPEPQLCMECHKDVGARMLLPSRHPIREGKMQCSSCHQVHGSDVGLLDTAERVNTLCVNCHTSKQGPFVFEHPPVMEDCTTCHVPHGSVADNLLKQNEPFLCLQCHEAHFHIGRSGSSEPNYVATAGSDNPFGPSGWRVAFGTKCTQCHQAVHGSDLPSQTVSGQGKSLTR